jgi:UDP-N-acetyl-D-mannosaminuronic acid dehydrogenase
MASGGSEVAVLGLGYVGLTLAVALADAGVETLGYDRLPEVVQGVRECRPRFEEPGVAEALRSLLPDRLRCTATLPARLPSTVIVCVGTPIDHVGRTPDLSQLSDALDLIGPRIDSRTTVVVRSTVPVGITEGFIRDRLAQFVEAPRLAFCPERTIQGQALRELRELPQIVGSADPGAAAAAAELFSRLGAPTVAVSSAAVAEMVKLVCNAHTDVIYGFGNEVALLAHGLGIDAEEVIDAANSGYPRPPIHRPGFVGGSCLVKDPYLLAHSVLGTGREPLLVAAARELNESVPIHVADQVAAALAADGEAAGESTVLVSGFAYKGTPVTDDTRGNAAAPLIESLRTRVGQLRGHDYVVARERIASFGAEAMDLRQGFRGAHAAVLLVDHHSYREEDVAALVESMLPPRLVYDLWGVWRDRLEGDGVDCAYRRLAHD